MRALATDSRLGHCDSNRFLTAEMWLLSVGEGNFSFSLSLAKKLRESHCRYCLYATSYEDYQECINKYGKLCESNIIQLKEIGAIVLHSIDAKNLKQSLLRHGQCLLFDKIIFNFPHTGRKASIKQNRYDFYFVIICWKCLFYRRFSGGWSYCAARLVQFE